jgi:glycerol-3-phosphate dehydrogenase
MTGESDPTLFDRGQIMARLAGSRQVDMLVIGGGATGLGVALDAVLRGLSVVLLESHDFAKGTSSRATKLVHGGVRYLAQGNIALVREALHERTALLRNAPHLSSRLPFVMPSYHCWETPFFGVGLKMYDFLAGRSGLGPTQFLTGRQALACLPTLNGNDLKGGVKYWDGQFDDARLALALARTAAVQGALIVNYCPVISLLREQGRVTGARCRDSETGNEYEIGARCIVNATGVWVDEVLSMDMDAPDQARPAMVSPSQGAHLVVDGDFLPGGHALLVPKTRDGRVLFAVPWLGKVILGTTDTACQHIQREPQAIASEVDLILDEAAKYLATPPTRADVRSIWVGLRPLARPASDAAAQDTQHISREHIIRVGASGLVTVTGGKWTTYRSMAEDVINRCVDAGLLSTLPPCRTANFPLVGASGRAHTSLSGRTAQSATLAQPPGLQAYGTQAQIVGTLPGNDKWIAPGLSQAMVRFAARYEYARTTEDMLARRSRLVFLDAVLAGQVADQVADILAEEIDGDPKLDAFLALARQYSHVPA